MKSFRYFFDHRALLDRFVKAKNDTWLRRDVPAGHLELRQPNFHEVDGGTFEIGWTVSLSSKFGSYSQMYDVPEALLLELHDMIGKLLELEPRPPEVKVLVEQRTRRRKRPRPTPLEQLVEKTDTALAPDEQAILHRMLEGK